MHIAIMSDSHDNIWNMRRALDTIAGKNIEMIIHCGDFVAPFMLKELAAPGIPVPGVFGNKNGDGFLLTKITYTDLPQITLHGITGQVEADGFTIGFAHESVIARGLLHQGGFNLVCFGHTHIYSQTQEKDGKTILLNPGEIMGKDGDPGFCVVDTAERKVERFAIS